MSPRAGVERAVRTAAAAVFLLALLAYGAAVAGTYAFDDVHSVADNPALRDVANVPSYWTDPSAFSRGIGRMYRPALLSSFALNAAISPAAWCLKAGNVLLHALVASLLFAWAWRLSRALRASAAVAALFAVHPLASEAVNLVSARSEVLMLLGTLVALHAHLGLVRGGNRWLHGVVVAGTVLACGSKETGVAVPLLGAFQAWVVTRGPSARATAVRAGASVLPAVAVVVAYLVARKLLLGEIAVPLLGRTGEDPTAGYGRTLAMQLATMGTLLPRCVLQLFVPWPLTVDPPVVFRASFVEPAVLLGWGTMLALTALAWRRGPTARLRRLGVVLAWATALPWIVVPLNMPLAEHRLYAPLAGAGLVAVAVLPPAARWRRWRPAVLRHAPHAALGLLLVGGAASSARQSLLWRDERALWSDALVHNPGSFRAWWGLGTSRLRAGDVLGALGPLATAHAANPRHFDTLRNYTEALVSVPDAHAEPGRALEVAARLLAASPDDPWARTLLAQAHLQAGRVRGAADAQAAREHFTAAERLALSCLTIAAPKAYVYQLAAAARRGLGDLPGALAHLDTSAARGLAPVALRVDRAALLRDLGRPRDAQQELLRAQREAPHDPQVLQALMPAVPPR